MLYHIKTLRGYERLINGFLISTAIDIGGQKILDIPDPMLDFDLLLDLLDLRQKRLGGEDAKRICYSIYRHVQVPEASAVWPLNVPLMV